MKFRFMMVPSGAFFRCMIGLDLGKLGVRPVQHDEMRSRWVKRFQALAAALGWIALALQFYLSMRLSIASGKGLLHGAITYFSFFTILTNILVALALAAPLLRVRSRAAEFFSRPSVNTGTAASIAVVGIAYALLLQHLWDPQGLQLVADVLLHYVMPVLFIAYWWVVPTGGVRWPHVFRWMLYPVAYFIYAVVRGALTGVYPYPFIDAGALGYTRALVNAAGILIGFVAVALLLVAVGQFKSNRGAGGKLNKPLHRQSRCPVA